MAWWRLRVRARPRLWRRARSGRPTKPRSASASRPAKRPCRSTTSTEAEHDLEGRHFCAGFNISSVADENAGASFEALANELEQARPVTIAAINGGVYGGATDLALACDFRIGVDSSQMFVPAARLGLLFYRGGLQRYVSRLGLNVAKKLLLRAATLDAGEMLACGFLDMVVAHATLCEEVERLSDELAGMAPLALLGMKKHLNRIANGTLDSTEFLRDVTQADASHDLREGSLAWKEKRKPV